MSSVAAKDMDAYQRAFQAYKRKSQAYNGSILKDANGNAYLFSNSAGGLFSTGEEGPNAMQGTGFYALGVAQQAINNSPQVANKTTGVVSNTNDRPTGYAGLTITSDGRYALGRTRAQTYTPVVIKDVVKYGNGYAVRSYDSEGNIGYQQLDPNKVEINAVPKAKPKDEQMYTATYQKPETFAAKPGTFTMQAPEITQAQGRRMNEGNLTDQERGLIGEVMASKGVRY